MDGNVMDEAILMDWGQEKLMCDVGERGVKRGSYFPLISQGTEVRQKSPIYPKLYIL
jgi:hypothetical protein